MIQELERFRPTSETDSKGALSLAVTNEHTRQEATDWLVRIRRTRKGIEEAGKAPIAKIRADLKESTIFVDNLVAPLRVAELHLNNEIGRFVAAERAAATALQEEAVRIAEEENRKNREAYEQKLKDSQVGLSPSEAPAPPEVVMPDIVVPEAKSITAETGEVVSTRMIQTYDVGSTIIDGKIVDSANLSPFNEDFKGLPLHLYDINLGRLRAFVKSGDLQLAETKIRTYKKPSIATRGI